MKRMIALALSVMVFACALLPTTAYASDQGSCDHYYERDYQGDIFTSDICTKCGQIRPNIDAPYKLPFIIREDTVVAREAPRQASSVVKQYNWGEKIQVVARIRNEYKNMWLKLSDGTYMYADRAAFDFDSMAAYALDSVRSFSGSPVCSTTFSFQSGLGIRCSYPLLGTLSSMYHHFKPGSTFDLKAREKLGLNSHDYYVYANGRMLDKQYTGEDLGNILYGYTCRSVGISLTNAIKFAGLAGSSGYADAAVCLFLNDLPKCDDPDDIDMVTLGWNRFVQSSDRFSGGGGGGGGGGGF